MTGQHLRPDPQLDDLVRRLRVWSFASWEHGDRIARTRAALQELADLAADADGRERPDVPELSVMALADQLAVLGVDALRATGNRPGNGDNRDDGDDGGDDRAAGLIGRLAGELGLPR